MSVELEMMIEENGRLRRHIKCLEVHVKQLEAKLTEFENQRRAHQSAQADAWREFTSGGIEGHPV